MSRPEFDPEADKPVEGDPGTWSHCGNTKVHKPHLHTVVFNEGPYPDIPCNGTTREQRKRANPKEAAMTEKNSGGIPRRADTMQEIADRPHIGSLLMDSKHTSYRAIGALRGVQGYMAQTIDGVTSLTTTLPEDTYYVFDAARPYRM